MQRRNWSSGCEHNFAFLSFLRGMLPQTSRAAPPRSERLAARDWLQSRPRLNLPPKRSPRIRKTPEMLMPAGSCSLAVPPPPCSINRAALPQRSAKLAAGRPTAGPSRVGRGSRGWLRWRSTQLRYLRTAGKRFSGVRVAGARGSPVVWHSRGIATFATWLYLLIEYTIHNIL